MVESSVNKAEGMMVDRSTSWMDPIISYLWGDPLASYKLLEIDKINNKSLAFFLFGEWLAIQISFISTCFMTFALGQGKLRTTRSTWENMQKLCRQANLSSNGSMLRIRLADCEAKCSIYCIELQLVPKVHNYSPKASSWVGNNFLSVVVHAVRN